MKVTYQCCWTSCSEETRTVWRYEVLVNHMSTRYSSDQYVVCQKQTSTEIHLLKSAVQTYQLVHCKVGILVGLLLFVGCRVGFFEGFAVWVGFFVGCGDGFPLYQRALLMALRLVYQKVLVLGAWLVYQFCLVYL